MSSLLRSRHWGWPSDGMKKQRPKAMPSSRWREYMLAVSKLVLLLSWTQGMENWGLALNCWQSEMMKKWMHCSWPDGNDWRCVDAVEWGELFLGCWGLEPTKDCILGLVLAPFYTCRSWQPCQKVSLPALPLHRLATSARPHDSIEQWGVYSSAN